jgi:hypothetical protein
MDSSSEVLTKAVSIMSVMLAAFGGALTKIQPPGDGINFAAFTGTFSSLIILLIIAAVAKSNSRRLVNVWIGLALISLAAFIYSSFDYFKYKVNQHVVGYPPDTKADEIIVGDSLTTWGIERKQWLENNNRPADKANIVAVSGGVPEISRLWKDIDSVNTRLNNKYLAMMICLSVAIFSITEGVFNARRVESGRPKPEANKSIEHSQ